MQFSFSILIILDSRLFTRKDGSTIKEIELTGDKS